ncbi:MULTISPECIES: hypothetical protein [Weeksella]|uniref:hypothetical protein n=1 Tax=Weeksella TaxID=1013 RepID=UPI0008A28AEE|nr:MULTISPECIES: hypothetical protein [Weeksella]MDK7375978.1 hypothetical protein [Weeksella virosa]OFM84572.1 hypothetical protein HMPREF2660_08660 [Weeksella sp. HMSC059D05]
MSDQQKNEIITKPLLLTEEEYEQIEIMASCNYTIKQMALYLDVPYVHFNILAYEKSSEVYRRIQKGRLEPDFLIDKAMQESAIKGNVTVIQQREKNKEARRIEDIKNHFFS